MDFQINYSPDILIYLEVEGKRIRLADVLYNTATLYQKAEIPKNAHGALVFCIDDKEEREDVILFDGISPSDSIVSFAYKSPDRLNGRHISRS